MPQEKLWGLIWNKGKGGQDTAIQNKKDNEIIIAYHSEKRGRAWTCCPINQIEKLIQSNRGLYEVLESYPKKLYFDVDFEDPPDDFCQESFLNMLTYRHSRIYSSRYFFRFLILAIIEFYLILFLKLVDHLWNIF